MVERRKTQSQKWGKSLMVLMTHTVVGSSFQIKSERIIVLFIVSEDLWNTANLRMLFSLERKNTMY